MSRVTYFPRYHSRENVVTNTTLHLFSQINQQSTERLRELLSQLFDGEELPLGISFDQQSRAETSVPDGSIFQESLHIVIETKVDAGVDTDQLIRHCEAFTAGRMGNYLMLLTKRDVPADLFDGVMLKAKEAGVIFKHVTFEKLYGLLDKFAFEHETHLKHVVEDFRVYCSDMDLLPDRRKWLRIVPCGNTVALNEKWDMYYDSSSKGYSRHEYIGIYNQKAVRYVGKVVAVYDNEDDASGGMRLIPVEGAANALFEGRIVQMVADTKAQVGWDVSSEMRFFCVEKFIPTEFIKISPGGIMGKRLWDVTDYVKPGMTDVEFAEVLRHHDWE